MDCWLLERGLKTLALRVRQQNENALKIAQYLSKHPLVRVVYYPGLESHPDHEIAKRQMFGGFGGMLSFELAVDDVDIVRSILDSFEIFVNAPSLGGVDSLVVVPALTSHHQIPREKRLELGIKDGFVRMSVGIEDVKDLIDDLEKGFAAAKGLLKF